MMTKAIPIKTTRNSTVRMVDMWAAGRMGLDSGGFLQVFLTPFTQMTVQRHFLRMSRLAGVVIGADLFQQRAFLRNSIKTTISIQTNNSHCRLNNTDHNPALHHLLLCTDTAPCHVARKPARSSHASSNHRVFPSRRTKHHFLPDRI